MGQNIKLSSELSEEVIKTLDETSLLKNGSVLSALSVLDQIIMRLNEDNAEAAQLKESAYNAFGILVLHIYPKGVTYSDIINDLDLCLAEIRRLAYQ